MKRPLHLEEQPTRKKERNDPPNPKQFGFERLCVNALGNIAQFLPYSYCSTSDQLQDILGFPFPYQRVVLSQAIPVESDLTLCSLLQRCLKNREEEDASISHSLREITLRVVLNENGLDKAVKELLRVVMASRALQSSFITLKGACKDDLLWLCKNRPRWSTSRFQIDVIAQTCVGMTIPANDWIVGMVHAYNCSRVDVPPSLLDAMADMTRTCRQLERLVVYRAVVQSGNREPLYFDKTCHLTELSLRSMEEQGPGQSLVPMFVAPLSSRLTKLSIVDCELRSRSVVELAKLLPWAAGLRSLDLSGNKLHAVGCSALSKWISSDGGSRLHSLSLNSCELSWQKAKLIVKSFRDDAELRKLSILELYGRVSKLREALKRIPKLEELGIGSHRFSRLLTETFGSIVHDTISIVRSQYTRLRVLDLSRWYIRKYGATIIATILCLPMRIKTLMLNDCGICAEGANSLASTLAYSTLERLELARNPLSDEGVSCLFAALGKSKALRELDLSEVDFDEESLTVLVQSLSKNSTVNRVQLAGARLPWSRFAHYPQCVVARICCHDQDMEYDNYLGRNSENMSVAANS